MKTIQVLGDRVLVDPHPLPTMSKGVHLVGRLHPTAVGTLLSVGTGPTCQAWGLRLFEGSHVVFRPMSGQDFEVDGRHLRLLEPDKVVGVLEPQTTD